AAGGDGRDVRRPPRAGGADPDRTPGRRPHRRPRRAPRRLRLRARPRQLLRHPPGARHGTGRRHRRHGRRVRLPAPHRRSRCGPAVPGRDRHPRRSAGDRCGLPPSRPGPGRSAPRGQPGAVDSGANWGGLVRRDAFLQHPVFASFRSETAMMRYLRRLADRDFALDRGMIPLGSCTMKLNAATEMAGITWREFNAVHPFAPRQDVEGYLEMITQLETWLADLTGYETVSLQPNAGSQGEFAGLLAIRAYHASRGEGERDVCLVPS